MIKDAIYKLINHKDLTYEESLAVMGEMMDGTATQAQMGGFLTALRMQGETIDEITAFATVMREKGVKLHPERDVMEIVGTGGDEVGTFNISTTSAFVVAAAGIPVAKHGNRAASSKCGTSDSRAERNRFKENRYVLYVRSGLSFFHALRCSCPQRTWRSYRI